MRGFVAGVVPPVWLHEHGVDLFEPDGLGLVAHGFDEGSDAEVLDRPEGALRDPQDEADGLVGEGLVGQSDEVKLAMNEGG